MASTTSSVKAEINPYKAMLHNDIGYLEAYHSLLTQLQTLSNQKLCYIHQYIRMFCLQK